MYNDTDSMKVGSPGICTELAMQVATPIRHKAAFLRLDRIGGNCIDSIGHRGNVLDSVLKYFFSIVDT